MKKLHVRTILPIYEARLQLIVAEDLLKERKRQEHLFGPAPKDFDALCSYSGGHNFALFFTPDALTHRVVGHEVWHLTKRICEWANVSFRDNESAALLCGWLHWWVYKHVGKIIHSERKA